MGFIRQTIKAGKDAITGTLLDQYKEVIRCENMANNILMAKKTTKNGVITKGSAIIVDPGQCAIICQNGEVLDATAEAGVYTFDESESASFFEGEFKGVFKEMWTRFTFQGGSKSQQAVYYFNMKEIIGNKFETKGAVPYKDWEHAVLNARVPGSYMPMSVGVTCVGTYTFKIVNPALFMKEVSGTATVYEKSSIVEQIRSEMLAVFQAVLNRLGTDEYKIAALDLPSKAFQIKEIMNQENLDQPIQARGIKLLSFAIEGVTLDSASKQKIEKWELGGDAYTQQGVITESYGEALKNAASNKNGAMTGFMGMNMMNMNMQAGIPQTEKPQPVTQQQGSVCPKCGKLSNGKFCSHCGAEMKVTSFCPNCGKEVAGKFCTHCGTEVSSSSEKKCNDCGTVVTGRFCPNCGKEV